MKRYKSLFAVVLSVLIIMSVFFGCAKTENRENLSENAAERNAYVSFIETDDDADCALIHIENTNILIDTGEKKDADDIIEFLEDREITSIDRMIITHFDKDHCGGGSKILEKFQVNEVIHPEYVKDSKEANEFLSAVRNKGVTETVMNQITEFRFNTVSLSFYPALTEYKDNTSNNSSLIVKLTYLEKTILFTGDIEAERIADILNDAAQYFDCDVLKVPYHGRAIEDEDAFISSISPQYSIVTGSGGKVKKNIKALGDILGETYYTKDGTITFYFNYNDDFEVTVYD